MKVATLWKARTDLTQEQQQQGLPRRAQWQPKARIVAEYWFLGAQRGEWAGLTVADVEDPAELMQDLLTWVDLLETRSFVAVTVEEGLSAAQQAMGAASVR